MTERAHLPTMGAMSPDPKPRPALQSSFKALPPGRYRWLWLAVIVPMALIAYTILLWLPGSFLVPAGLWTAWCIKRAQGQKSEQGSETAELPTPPTGV